MRRSDRISRCGVICNGDRDPTSAGTVGEAVVRDGSRVVVGMAAIPFGAHQAESRYDLAARPSNRWPPSTTRGVLRLGVFFRHIKSSHAPISRGQYPPDPRFLSYLSSDCNVTVSSFHSACQRRREYAGHPFGIFTIGNSPVSRLIFHKTLSTGKII